MKNTILIILLILILFLTSCGSTQSWVSSSLKNNNNVRIAFSGIDVRNILSNEYSENIDKQFSDSLQFYFLKAGYSVIERGRIHKLLNEIKFQGYTITSDENVVEIGKILNVEYVVFGSANYELTMDSPFIKQCTVKMVKVETGETVLVSNWDGAGLHIGQVAQHMGESIYSEIMK